MTSRDVESLVNCSSLPAPGLGQSSLGNSGRRLARQEYQNDAAAEQLESERSATHYALRKTVETASLQIVIVSKPLLTHVGRHANDPLGQLLSPDRVIALLLAVDEAVDITPLHRSGIICIHKTMSYYYVIES